MPVRRVAEILDPDKEKDEQVTQNGWIVVGVDGSEHGERALDWAIEEAKLRSAQLRLVCAWHVPAVVYGGPGFAPQLDEPLDNTFEEVAQEVADDAAKRAREAGVEAETSVVQGQAAEALVEAGGNADLLVVGSRGHGGFTGLLLGSVSAQCAHHSLCALVIVRPNA
jgi:nucleotide-binding universal stress UspA family protein